MIVRIYVTIACVLIILVDQRLCYLLSDNERKLHYYLLKFKWIPFFVTLLLCSLPVTTCEQVNSLQLFLFWSFHFLDCQCKLDRKKPERWMFTDSGTLLDTKEYNENCSCGSQVFSQSFWLQKWNGNIRVYKIQEFSFSTFN